MKVYFATDHAGFDLKNVLVEYVTSLGHDVEDLGAHEMNAEDDYPDFVGPLATQLGNEPDARGVILGKSGEGEAMVANRTPGIRAAVYYGGQSEIPKLAREHNNANMLSLGAGFITEEEAKEAVKIFLETAFSTDPRHARRLAKF